MTTRAPAVLKRLGQTVANCYIANYSIEKLQAIAKFSVKLSQYVHCKILAQTREQSYIVNYSIKCRKRLQYLRSNYCNPCIAHYFANNRKLLPNLRSNYRNPCIAHYFVNYGKLFLLFGVQVEAHVSRLHELTARTTR